jgi:hypothetical protein
MSFRLADLPVLEQSGRRGRQADPALAEAYRDTSTPSVAEQVTALGAALGLDAVRVLQQRFMPGGGEVAAAHHGGPAPSYTTWTDCAGHNDTNGCDAPCIGFPLDQMATWYCASCDEQAADPTHNPAWNWHFTGTRGSITYGDYTPNICGTAGKRDAWKWSIQSACRQCDDNITFRCHDGWKKYDPNGPLTPTICEGIIACDGQLNLCP